MQNSVLPKSRRFGLGLRPPHFEALLSGRYNQDIDWLEIISENFMDTGGFAKKTLLELRKDFPVATHGVGLSIAGFCPLDFSYLKKLRDLIEQIQPFLVSDHLCWTSWKGKHSYDLLPFPFNEESLTHVAQRVEIVQDFLQRTLVLENPSAYVDFQVSTMSEVDFLRRLSERTGCKILLDLNNCEVNAKNLGWSSQEYLYGLSPESVYQFHLAGHMQQQDIVIDTHDQAISKSVWELYRKASSIFYNAATLIEWDDNIPPIEALVDYLKFARKQEKESKPDCFVYEPHIKAKKPKACTLAELQENFFRAMKEETHEIEQYIKKTSPKLGLEVYSSAYGERILEVLEDCFKCLHYILGEKNFRELTKLYLDKFDSYHFSINWVGSYLCDMLPSYLSSIELLVEDELLMDIATLEWNYYRLWIETDEMGVCLNLEDLKSFSPRQWESLSFQLQKNTYLLPSKWPVHKTWQAIQDEIEIEPPGAKQSFYLIYREQTQVKIEELEYESFLVAKLLENPSSLEDLTNINELSFEQAITQLTKLCQISVIILENPHQELNSIVDADKDIRI